MSVTREYHRSGNVIVRNIPDGIVHVVDVSEQSLIDHAEEIDSLIAAANSAGALAAENAKLRGEVEAERNHKVYLAAIMRRYLQWDSNKSPYTREYCLAKLAEAIRMVKK